MIKSYVWRDRGGWSYIVCCCLSPVSVEETAPFASERDSVNQSINQSISLFCHTLTQLAVVTK